MKTKQLFQSLIFSAGIMSAEFLNAQALCQAGFTFNVNNNVVTFTNTSTGTIQPTYYWNFGDSNTDWQTNPIHTYMYNGTYTVCLTMWDSLGSCQSTFCDSVVITGAPNCVVSVTGNTTIYSGSTTTLCTSFSPSCTNSSYFWSTGATTACIVVSPTTSSTYTVTVCCSTTSCCASASATVIVLPPSPCDSSFTAWVDTSSGGGVWFFNNGQNNVSCFWDFGDGNTGTGCWQVYHQYAQTGWYNACLTVITSSGDTCIGCDSVYVFICNMQASFTFNNANDPIISFAGTSSGFGMPSYNWNFGDGNSGSGVNVSHTYQYNGIYQVCLYVGDSSPPYCSAVYCDTITIMNATNPPCDSSFTMYTDTSGSGWVWFYPNGSNNVSCSWDFGDGNFGTGCSQVSHQYSVTGTYYVCLTVTDVNGNSCTGCDSVYVLRLGSGIYEQDGTIFGIKNYPNPFSHSTVISYSMKEKSEVNVSVYNNIGEKVAELEDGKQESGTHQIEWNAENLTSGVYFLEIKSRSGVLSRKMILIK